ncbi:MAG: MFS transporter [Neisseriales bacterium]|nr:MAG: MFS transporter [Neisseriales bacterium]
MQQGVNNNSLLNTRRFLPLFSIQFLNAVNDHILKNAILVMITYQGMVLSGMSREMSVNLATLLFILPFFLCSSYAGKIADAYSKVFLIKIIKFCEIGIVVLAAIGFICHDFYISIIALIGMGIHSSFFGPIKYSILPQYFNDRKPLLLANGYIELGTFVAVLLGQMLGSWYMANNQLEIVILMMAFSTFMGLILSFRLEKTLPAGELEKINWNVFKETLKAYRKITTDRNIRNNLHAISWFWAMGVIYTTQLPVFTQEYMGGCAHVFSVLLGLFSVSIGLGSVVCAKISNGHIRKHYVIYGALGKSLFSIVLLALNYSVKTHCLSLGAFSHQLIGLINFILIFFIGFSAGFYSVTCYNELQVSSPLKILSQVIAVNNLINAAYMVLASIICSILLIFINLWWLLMLAVICNCVFVFIYWRWNFRLIAR